MISILQQRARAFDHLFDAVVVTDSQGIIIDWNMGAEHLYGYSRSEAIGQPVNILHAPEDVERITAEVFASIARIGYWTGEIKKRTKDQSIGWIESFVIPLYDEQNQPIGALGINRDITKRKLDENALLIANQQMETQLKEIRELQATLHEQANRDSLTQLYNRRFLLDTLDREFILAQRHSQFLSIVLLDIDHFKSINDSYGHVIGDECLINLAQIMRKHFRKSDIICRYGGEEFLIVLPDSNTDLAAQRVEELRQLVANNVPVQSGMKKVKFTISSGIATFPVHGDNSAEIIRKADHAMYESKQAGRNRITVWSERYK